MRAFFLSVVAFIFFCLITSTTSHAATRYATCDACGLCPTIDVQSGTCIVDAKQLPGDWRNCAKCLYGISPPSAPTLPGCDTLVIKPDNTPSKPVRKGVQFTLLGCISSGTSVGFDDNQNGGQRGAPSFVQALLNVVFSLAGGLAFLYLMYGGFVILTSQADPERLNYGRRLIYGAIVGLIITISSVFVVNLIGSGILHIPGFNGAT
ncbi:MAG: hypothetical protein V1922_04830 [bacterium]